MVALLATPTALTLAVVATLSQAWRLGIAVLEVGPTLQRRQERAIAAQFEAIYNSSADDAIAETISDDIAEPVRGDAENVPLGVSGAPPALMRPRRRSVISADNRLQMNQLFESNRVPSASAAGIRAPRRRERVQERRAVGV